MPVIFWQVYAWVCADICTKCNKIPSRRFWGIVLMRMGHIWGHNNLDLLPPKSVKSNLCHICRNCLKVFLSVHTNGTDRLTTQEHNACRGQGHTRVYKCHDRTHPTDYISAVETIQVTTYLALASWTWDGFLRRLSQGRDPHNQCRRQKPRIWKSPRRDGATMRQTDVVIGDFLFYSWEEKKNISPE